MRRCISGLLSTLLIFSLITPAEVIHAEDVSFVPEKENAYVEGEVLVTLNSSKKTDLAVEGTTSFDEEITVDNTWNFGDTCISEVSSDSYTTEELMEELTDQKNVAQVEPNYYRYKMDTNDACRKEQWYLNGTGSYQGTSEGIRYDTLNQTSTQEDTVIAVVDTGIDYTHEDLKENMWVNPYSSSSLPGTYGYDFGDNDDDPMDDDEDGHGTHCAGIISAVSDNKTGICGISNARLMALKIFDSDGNASDSSIIAAFNYIYQAQSLGAKITAVNCSWGGGGSTPSSIKKLINKIGEKGALFVFAVGNNNKNHDTSGSPICPYDVQSDYIITVGASDCNDKKASFSDYGKCSVDLFAPGDRIFSTVNSYTFYPSSYDAEKQNKLCKLYHPFDTDNTEIYTPSEVGRKNSSLSYLKKSFSTEDSYGNPNSGSMVFSIRALHENASLELFLDITELNPDTGDSYFLSYDFGTRENNSIYWEHRVSSSKSASFASYNGRTYLRVVGLSGDFSDFPEIYLDNVAVSKPNPDTAAFGKYNTLSGTSMAAPVVTAATAILSSMYTNDSTVERRNRLLNCVRKTDDLSYYCITGGILDFSRFSTSDNHSLTPTLRENNTKTDTGTSAISVTKKIPVRKIQLNKKKATLRYGKKLKLKATVTPKNATNKKVKWSVSNKKYASVSQKGVVRVKKKGIGHTVKVYAKAKDNSGKKAYCKVKLKKKVKKKKK